jgi:hypothetical protein
LEILASLNRDSDNLWQQMGSENQDVVLKQLDIEDKEFTLIQKIT